jgi:hypothetical protein
LSFFYALFLLKIIQAHSNDNKSNIIISGHVFIFVASDKFHTFVTVHVQLSALQFLYAFTANKSYFIFLPVISTSNTSLLVSATSAKVQSSFFLYILYQSAFSTLSQVRIDLFFSSTNFKPFIVKSTLSHSFLIFVHVFVLTSGSAAINSTLLTMILAASFSVTLCPKLSFNITDILYVSHHLGALKFQV